MFKCRDYIFLGALYSLLFSTDAFARHIEANQITTLNTATTPTFTSVTFLEPFDTVPIVVSTPSDEGGDPADLRIRNVTTTGFEITVAEPPGNDGPHIDMTVDYIAIEAGVTTLPNGTVIVAGFHSTTSTSIGGNDPDIFDTVAFGMTLSTAPSVVANIQTVNNEDNTIPGTFSQPFLSIAVRNANTTSVQLSLERSETAAFGDVTTDETIGWIAFPNGSNGDLTDTSGNIVGWDARITPDNITGFDNGACVTNTFSATPWPNARVVGTREGRDGADGGWLRRCSISNTAIGFEIDEDISNDTERSHTDENASLLSFENSFHAILGGELIGSKDVEMVTSAEYSIPGNEVRYRLTAESIGNSAIDAGTVIFTDSLPAEVALIVDDIDSAGSGPVRFIDGSPSSGLTYNFNGLTSTTDDVDFSDDGGSTFTYTPTPDSAGADRAVTHIRISPSGPFLAFNSSGSPNFAVEFDAVIR